jgi:hypothetical protein
MCLPSALLRKLAAAFYARRFRSAPSLACVRVNIRQGKWKHKDPNNRAHLSEAIKDLEVKPKDNGGYSVYVVRSMRQGCRVALLHQVTNNPQSKPLQFLFVPVSCLAGLPLQLQIVRQVDLRRQHPILNKHHFVVYGLDRDDAKIELAAAILRNQDHRVVVWTRLGQIRRARVIAGRWLVRRFMRFEKEWREAVSNQ